MSSIKRITVVLVGISFLALGILKQKTWAEDNKIIYVPYDHFYIQKVIDTAEAGTKIKMEAGIYSQLITMKEGITLVGAENPFHKKPIIDDFTNSKDNSEIAYEPYTLRNGVCIRSCSTAFNEADIGKHFITIRAIQGFTLTIPIPHMAKHKSLLYSGKQCFPLAEVEV